MKAALARCIGELSYKTGNVAIAVFHPGKTSRINVAHFMADLMTDATLWHKWQGQMPVIYNKAAL